MITEIQLEKKKENPQESPTQINKNHPTPGTDHHIPLGAKKSVLMQSQNAEI